MKFWAKVELVAKRRASRFSFASRREEAPRRDGRVEYILRIPGFSGELRKFMLPEEAEEFRRRSNTRAYKAAEKASKQGQPGRERFAKEGFVGEALQSTMMDILMGEFKHDNRDNGSRGGGEGRDSEDPGTGEGQLRSTHKRHRV